MTVWKYPLSLTDRQVVGMPEGAEILTAQFQGEVLCLWAHVHPGKAIKKLERRTILICGTGNPAPEIADSCFIATAQQFGGSLVWHVFEQLNNPENN